MNIRKLLTVILDWPNIHTDPDRAAALVKWGDEDTDDPALDEKVRAKVVARRDRARKGIDKRMSQRGRSLTATLVFIGFLVAAEVALIGLGFASTSGYLKFACKPTIVALIVILWGIRPTLGNLIPRRRGDEGVEALENTEFDWFCEDVSRCSAQRQQLWRLRVALTGSLVLDALTLLLFLFK